MDETLAIRFFQKVEITETCWNWTAATRNGYGAFSLGKKKVGYAHRLSFEFHGGVLKHGEQICHKCDNRICVNPNHLFAGTALDNQRDKVSKNRQSRYESHGMHKLTFEQVKEIRGSYKKYSADHSAKRLAKKFGVSPWSIYKIIKNEAWKV